MGKRIAMVYTRKGESRYRTKVLFLISAVFLFGGILGYVVQDRFPATMYIHQFLEEAEKGTIAPSIWQESWRVLRWPVGLLIFWLSPLAGILIPALVFLRGFLLSVGIAAFSAVSLPTAILLFGPTSILTLPVLFILSIESLLQKAGEESNLKPSVWLACLLALCLCMVIDLTAVPHLLK